MKRWRIKMLSLLLVSEEEAVSYYCSSEEHALEIAKYEGFYNKPGDKICLIDFENNKSSIYELGDDFISTVY
jgi:hypothetical protein